MRVFMQNTRQGRTSFSSMLSLFFHFHTFLLFLLFTPYYLRFTLTNFPLLYFTRLVSIKYNYNAKEFLWGVGDEAQNFACSSALPPPDNIECSPLI